MTDQVEVAFRKLLRPSLEEMRRFTMKVQIARLIEHFEARRPKAREQDKGDKP